MTDFDEFVLEESARTAGDDPVVDVVRETDATRIVLEGDVDVCTVGRLQSFIEAECAFRGSHTIVIDLSAVEFVDSHGLRLLANTHQSLTREGGKLVVVPPPATVWRAFVVTGLDAVLDVQRKRRWFTMAMPGTATRTGRCRWRRRTPTESGS